MLEDDKKKKRNKKKKNKQNKNADDAVSVAEETASGTKNQLSNGKEEDGELSDSVDRGNSNADSNAHQVNGTANNVFEDTINQLHCENQLNLQKQKSLEERIQFLERGLDSSTQKEAMSPALIAKLRDENETYLQKQVYLEERIKQLCSQNESQRKKQADLEMIILQFRNEKDSLMQMKTGLEETINQSVLEKENLEKRAQFLEGELDSSIKNENSAKETIGKLHIDVTKLQMQVVELEHSRSTLLQENQQLTGNTLVLQSTIEKLEKRYSSLSSSESRKDQTSGNGDSNSQLEAAFALVEKLITENAELVEKVTELCAKLDQQRKMAVHHGTSDPVSMAETAAKIFNIPDAMPLEDRESLEVVSIGNASDDNLGSKADVGANPSCVSESAEIVSVPLIENETGDSGSAGNIDNKADPVPLSDAPLIGAPFRIVSFVAKYVSGADLVDNNSGH